MASGVFANGVINMANNSADWASNSVKALLINTTGQGATKVQQFDTHNDVADILTTWRAVATAAKWKQLTSTLKIAGGKVQFGSASESFSFTAVGNGKRCNGIVIFHSKSTEATSPVFAYLEFTSSVLADGGAVTVTLNASGAFLGSN